MGTIAIAVDGKQVFNWRGDEVEAKQILKDFRRAARYVGLTPEEFSYNCVKGVAGFYGKVGSAKRCR